MKRLKKWVGRKTTLTVDYGGRRGTEVYEGEVTGGKESGTMKYFFQPSSGERIEIGGNRSRSVIAKNGGLVLALNNLRA